MIDFAELHCLSNYSFLQGASHPEELVLQAFELGYLGLAITDECSVAGSVKAWKQLDQLKEQAASENPEENHAKRKLQARLDRFRLVTGSEFRHGGHHFVVLATTKTAYAELCRLITRCRREAEKGSYHFHPEWLREEIQTGLLLWLPGNSSEQTISAELIAIIKSFGDRCWLLLQLLLTDHDAAHSEHVAQLSERWQLPIVASSYPQMHSSRRKMLHDCLRAIDLNMSVKAARATLMPNAQNHLRPLSRLAAIYPAPVLQASMDILARCTFQLDEITYQYPREAVPEGLDPSTYLRKLTFEGAQERYPAGIPDNVLALIEKELRIIAELRYEYYFLTIHDIVRYAKAQDILCQGRGSAANSAVCYCLGITEVDPSRSSMLFERFISKRRNEPPDIDVDFDNSRREEVIQYIYRRYGRERCAIAATVISYRPKSAIRDLGKALGLEMHRLEKAIANFGWGYRSKANWIDEVFSSELSDDSKTLRLFKRLLDELLGFPRHLSQHVGGFVITEGHLTDLVPIENAAMVDRTVIQWDKNDLEALHLMKVDVLALGMMSALHKSFAMISGLTGRTFRMSDIPPEADPRVFDMLCRADSIGLFQVESRAQMNMLPRLRPATFYDLVVQIALVRPGPIHGDMVHPYLRRRAGLETVEIPLEELKPILARTYGVPIFQEQVIAMAMIGAGFTADEAEALRRAMASWKKTGHMSGLREKLKENLAKRGVPDSFIDRIGRQIEGFGEYGFPESHAASFALLVYASAWLKCYYPLVFCCALLNSHPMGFYQPWQLIQDAKRHDVLVLPVDINRSQWDHTLEPISEPSGKGASPEQDLRRDARHALRLGFRLVKGIREDSGRAIVSNRPAGGFQSYAAVVNIAEIRRDELEALASADAFSCFGEHRYQQRWQAAGRGLYKDLFSESEQQRSPVMPPDRLQNLLEDYDSTSVLLKDHPMAYLRDNKQLHRQHTAESLARLPNKSLVIVSGVVINRQRPKTAAGVTFLTLEDETGSINLVVWLALAKKQMKVLVQSRILKVYGKVERDVDGQVVHVIAHHLEDISEQIHELKSASRDFQ
ncbi:error-prone DNA polymerase [Allohahella marinimesophila]|uniref:Error-prone DNA polymerase n=1 Tax=Allohahella marinimesophila TaxID=1054972 RepID=A0ABP7NNT2_9GAMM